MATYVDPKTGERFDNDAEDADARAAQVGLVPLAQFEADNRPFLESAGESVQAAGNTLLRPFEALGEALPRSRMAEIGARVGDTWSPSSDDSRRIAQEHPIASAVPLALEGLVPGGPLVQAGVGALAGAAEMSFQGGEQYGAINPDDLLLSAGMAGGLAGVAPAVRGVGRLGRAATTKLSELGAGKLGKALSSGIGRNLTEGVAEEAVETGLKGAGAALGGIVGGTPGMAAGWFAGRQLNKRYGDRLVNALYKAAKGAEDTSGLGVKAATTAADGAPAAAAGGQPWSAWTPIDAEKVTVGTGLGSVFQRAEREMSPALKRARMRADQGGSVAIGEAPTVPPKGRAARAAGKVEQLPERDVTPTKLYPESNKARSEYGDAMYPHRDAQRTEAAKMRALAREHDLGSVTFTGTGSKRADKLAGKLQQALDEDTAHAAQLPELEAEYHRLDEAAEAARGTPAYSDARKAAARAERDWVSADTRSPKTRRYLDAIDNVLDDSGSRELREKLTEIRNRREYNIPADEPGDSRGAAEEFLSLLKRGDTEAGNVALGKGPNFSLGDVAKSPMGVVTGLGAAGGIANVLARSERLANESIGFDDLDDLQPADRAAAIAANGQRYAKEATDQATSALEEKTGAAVAAKDALRKRLPQLTAVASDAQRQYASVALEGIEGASVALRNAGNTEAADRLDAAADSLTDVAVAHQQKLPVTHDPGEVLGALQDAYGALRGAGELPPDAAAALADLDQGTTRPELWGQAADAIAEMRAADDAVDSQNILDSSDQDAWRQALTEHINGARMQSDVLAKWGVDTEDLDERLNKLQEAVDRGELVASELAAAGVRGNDTGADDGADGPLGEILGAVGEETGAGDLESVLTGGMRGALEKQQRMYRYDNALRTVQRGADLSLKKAARGMAGLGGKTAVEPDASSADFSAGYSDETAAFEARRGMIERLASSPDALLEAMSSSYGDLVRTHPDVYDAVSGMVVRATDILTEAMPPSMLNSLQHPKGLPPSVDDIRAFSRVYMAVTEPASYLRDLGAGQAWPEQSQAFARMYPQQWAALGQEAVAAATQRGPALTPQEATYLDITFGIGNTIGGMWSDAGAEAIRNANAARIQQNQERAQNLGKPSPNAAGPTSATNALTGTPSNTPVS